MSLSGKQSPLSLNVIGALLQNSGLKTGNYINKYVGTSEPGGPYGYGTIIGETCLLDLMLGTIFAYTKIGSGIPQSTYDNLINIGSGTIPAMGNVKPSTYTGTYTSQDAMYGFLQMLALQAHEELYLSNDLYSDFAASFIACRNYVVTNNNIINSYVNSKSFMRGTYSNMNDLSTADITSVSIATLYWGQDLINLGRAIDLTKIATFGTPSDLLFTVQKNSGLTKALSIALLACDLTSSEILSILSNSVPATPSQQKKIYSAFKIILGNDLNDILIPMNCQTKGLESLADLLNPMKMFPNSYRTLTVPKYNSTPQPTNSRTAYLIYENSSVNSQLTEFGTKFRNILPEDIAIACGSFSVAIRQIKNISSMSFEKFAQVVANIETMKGLDVNNTDVPTNEQLINGALSKIATGTGPNGSFTLYDFFGTLVGNKYPLEEIQTLIYKLQTPALLTTYNNIRILLNGTGPYTSLQSLINDANLEIDSILNDNPTDGARLNFLWDKIGKLSIDERTRRNTVLQTVGTSSSTDIFSFVDSISIFATETTPEFSVDVLEKIADTNTVGGNSLIALMRETRNAYRVMLAGGTLDNNISNVVSTTYNNLGIPRVTGKAIPGSLASSPEMNLIPKQLNILEMDPAAVESSVYDPDEAIADIIRCNCDCWDDL